MMRWIAILGASVLALLLTFGVGLLVGRYWEGSAARDAGARETAARDAGATPAKKAASARRGASGEGDGARPREGSETLTFYQTLTAPLGPSPSHARPAHEARPRPPAPATAAPAAAPSAQAPPAAEPPRALAAAAASWSVQVGAFQSRPQADTLQQELRRAGFEAYLTTLGTPDGQTRFRVRVGTFADRVLAQRTADRLRAERSLPSYVTPN